MKEIDGAAGQPFDAGKRDVEAVPDAGEVTFRNGRKCVQRERGVGPLIGGYCSGNEEREVVAGIVLHQRFDLPAYDAADAGSLAHGRCVIDYQLHSPLNVQRRLAAILAADVVGYSRLKAEERMWDL